jgi:DNA processing protein
MLFLAPSPSDLKKRFVGNGEPAGVEPSDDALLEAAALHLALLAVPGVGTVGAARLLEARGGIEAVAASDDDVGSALRRSLRSARAVIGRAVARGIDVVPIEHPRYPLALLHNVDGPPLVLFVQGRLPAALDAPAHELRSCSVVGTRRASQYSLDLAAAVAHALVLNQILVVSGLALGVDAAAHQGALDGARSAVAGGATPGPATIAVLGGGHFHLHPSGNANLAARIVAQGGALVSEWPPDTPPARHHFLRRNRIISALSRCVLIVEAPRRSGALNTATHAIAQARQVLVVPGRPDDPRYRGNLGLLRDGAGVFTELSDVLLAFGIAADASADAASHGEVASTGPRSAIPWSSPLPSIDLGPLAETVRRLLSDEVDVSFDHLLARLAAPGTSLTSSTPSQVSAADLTGYLTALELTGEVERTAGGRYRLRRISAFDR